MRSRSNSGARLDYYQRIITKTILVNQNPITGLFPASTDQNDAWVRDNVYCILAVWGLSMAYRKNADVDEDCAKAYELEQCCVKSMRGLLMSMMMQVDKVEKFKSSQSTVDCLHAKYSSSTGKTVVGDREWGHLQIDATSLFILALAQLTASGLQIIFSLDEVAFVQNLVFYIESAYRIPDYGIWERGDKTNHGLPELNASSIGMAKAALEAINELDLFGARGGPASVIYVLADEIQNCAAVLQSMLPRESTSKEVDAALLSIISFPAFAVDDPELIEFTRETILTKLRGRYGFKRFLRDGHKTAKEDPNRLYYEPWELKVFENIECEWPMFYCYLILDGLFNDNKKMVDEYCDALEKILVKTEDGLKLVPELYVVPIDRVESEYKEPHSQDRFPIGKLPYMWGQSLYILGKLVREGFIAVGELDPLNRRLCSEKRPDIVVQVVIIAEDDDMKKKLEAHDLRVQTLSEISPIVVKPAIVLKHIYARLGKNSKLNLSGRPSNEVGVLSTSKLYILHDRIFVFTPQFLDLSASYLARDISLLTDTFRNEIAFLKANWNMLGRPTMTILLKKTVLEYGKIPSALLALYKKIKSGYSNGTRVILGNLQDFLSTSCVTQLTFLGNQETGDPEGTSEEVKAYLNMLLLPMVITTNWLSTSHDQKSKRRISMKMKQSVQGIIRRTKSIQIDAFDPEILKLRARFSEGGSNTYQSSRSSPYPSSPTALTPVLTPVLTPAMSPTTSPSCTVENLYFELPHYPTILQGYETVELEELVQMLQETDSLKEQADIIHYLYVTKGADWNFQLDGRSVVVEDLLKELYDKACQNKKWLLVRHTAGILGKRIEDLAKGVTDLLVRQKQLTVGMPPYNERTITRPLPPDELRTIIHEVYGMDRSTAMLSQELLVYLAMFIRTEPQLFSEMLRLRVGLIIQVMASELARALNCAGEDAADFLLNLSPFELKTLLHHILSGNEFGINPDEMASRIGRINLKSLSSRRNTAVSSLNLIEAEIEVEASVKQGQWLRRRRLDGSLNRVPTDFYPKVWLLLERCHGLIIEGAELISSLTREMTPGELKFALQVETVLNRIPYPEYRQLLVEAMMVLTLIVENDHSARMDEKIIVENFVFEANRIFLIDQFQIKGDATTCCATSGNPEKLYTSRCGGAAGVCQYLYDSAPSGRYGSMTYLCKATAGSLNYLKHKNDFDCAIC